MKKMTYPTIDEVRETFIDINMDCLLDMYDHLKIEHEDMGFMNKSKSSEFVAPFRIVSINSDLPE